MVHQNHQFRRRNRHRSMGNSGMLGEGYGFSAERPLNLQGRNRHDHNETRRTFNRYTLLYVLLVSASYLFERD